jgi:biopolymer transport protein ExbB/TolQ
VEEKEIKEILIQTRDIALEFARKTDTLNHRLITVLMVTTISLVAIMCLFTYCYFSSTYEPTINDMEIITGDTSFKHTNQY